MTVTALENHLRSAHDSGYREGYRAAEELLRTEKQSLEEQRARLSVQQTEAVTKLIEACNANLSKAGYLIGKLNKDTSR